jgi:hypothetical protein
MTSNGVEIYISFIPKFKNRLDKHMDEILEEIGKPYYPGKLYEVLLISGEDENGEDVVSPFILYKLK